MNIRSWVFLILAASIMIKASADYEEAGLVLLDSIRDGKTISEYYQETDSQHVTLVVHEVSLRVHRSIRIRYIEDRLLIQRVFPFDVSLEYPDIYLPDYYVVGGISTGNDAEEHFESMSTLKGGNITWCSDDELLRTGHLTSEGVTHYFIKGDGFFLDITTQNREDFEYMTRRELIGCSEA